MKFSKTVLAILVVALCANTVTPARANLVINPIFASNITSDANATQIKAAINSAISAYSAAFSDPITVNITFQEGLGLGSSTFSVYSFSYTTFYNALKNDTGQSADDLTALARLALDGANANGTPKTNNPVTTTSTVLLKAANAHALGLSCASQGCGASEGGTITLNTGLTTPGSNGTSATYNLIPVVQHEIDEILGLGSTLGLGLAPPLNNDPYAEDFFRFASNNTRSFNSSGAVSSYFSIDGTTLLAQFNQNSSGDYGDWVTGASPQVQDAFATPSANPSLNVEYRALDVIGYNRITVVAPEPGSLLLMGSGLLLAGFARRRQRR